MTNSTLRVNKFAGRCSDCGHWVLALAGSIKRNAADTGWNIHHLSGECLDTPAPAPKGKAAPTAPLAPGMYWLDGEFYKVKANQSKTSTYAMRAVTTRDANRKSGWKVSFDYAPGIVSQLTPAHVLTAAQAQTFGAQFSCCVVCGADLGSIDPDDVRSVAAGYGETCARNLGWYYPSKAEARDLLAIQTVKGN